MIRTGIFRYLYTRSGFLRAESECVYVFRFVLFFYIFFSACTDPNVPDDDAHDNIDREICPDRISRESGAARHKRATDERGEKT